MVGAHSGISLDTVYRTADWLENHRLILRLESGGENRYDGNLEPHCHFRCEICGEVFDLWWDWKSRIDIPAEIPGIGRIDSCELQLRGICCQCRKKQSA